MRITSATAEVEDRAIPGHWEGDLLAGSKNSHIATLVERHSRFVMLIKVPSKDTTTVVAALSKHVLKLPATLRRSLTWDRGLEMAKHKSFTMDTKVKVYFCDPQSPWQRGSNENTNGLLRQYFPKKTDLSGYSQSHLNRVALRLNRPRRVNSKPVLHRPVETVSISGNQRKGLHEASSMPISLPRSSCTSVHEKSLNEVRSMHRSILVRHF